MTDQFFNVDLLRSVVTTFLGATLAIIVAFGLRWLAERESRNKSNLRRSQLARALAENIEFNLETATQVREMGDDSILTVNVDVSLVEATRSLKYEVMNDIELSRDIDEVGYQFSTLHRLIAVRFELEYSGSFLALSNKTAIRHELNELVRARATRAIDYENGKDVLTRLREIAGPISPPEDEFTEPTLPAAGIKEDATSDGRE